MALENGQALRKGAWTRAEDMILVEYVNKYGEGDWNSVGKIRGLARNAKSCRLRWANHLRPNIKKGAFSEEEKELIVELHAKLGNKWSLMAARLPGRTDNEIKNFWNTRLKRLHRDGLPIYNKKVEQPNKLLNLSGPSSTSYPLINPYRPSHIGSFNTQENQHVPTYMNHHLEHFQYNNKDPFLNHGLSDSFPMPSMLQFSSRNFCISAHPNVELSLIHSLVGFTPATASSSDWRMTGNSIITSTDNNDNKDMKVHGEGILGDELMNLLDSSPSSGPIPEWSELLATDYSNWPMVQTS